VDSSGRRVTLLSLCIGVYMIVYMRAIQVTFDDELLQHLDADPEVKKLGRSAVLRRAAVAYLKRKRGREIDERLERGYRAHPPTEFAAWSGEDSWPDE